MMTAKGRDECQHGSLRRSCEICERDETIREQAARIAVLEDQIKQARKGVPLHALLEYGALFVAVICALSLVSWATGNTPLTIINPFAALFSLVASPFFYWMGRVARSSSRPETVSATNIDRRGIRTLW